jgi:hypothetical protein
MPPLAVMGLDPAVEDTRGVLLTFKAMSMHAVLLEGADDALDQAVL